MLAFSEAGSRIDGRLVRHETVRVDVGPRGGPAWGAIEVSRAPGAGFVQVLDATSLPPGFGVDRTVWREPGAWCFLASAFQGRALRQGEEIAIPLALNSGALPLALATFRVVGTERVGERDAVVVQEMGVPEDRAYRLWLDPSWPCPLKAQGRQLFLDASPGARTFTAQLARVTPGEGEPVFRTGGAPPLPATGMPLAASQPWGVPPDGPNAQAFPLRAAVQAALEDDGLRRFLDQHPAALLVYAWHYDFELALHGGEYWDLYFADSRASHRVSVSRSAHAGLEPTTQERVTSSRPEAPPAPYGYGALLERPRSVLTLGGALAAFRQVVDAPATQVAYGASPLDFVAYRILFSLDAQDPCGLLTCSGEGKGGSVTFDLLTGTLTGYMGPDARWKG